MLHHGNDTFAVYAAAGAEPARQTNRLLYLLRGKRRICFGSVRACVPHHEAFAAGDCRMARHTLAHLDGFHFDNTALHLDGGFDHAGACRSISCAL